MRRLDQNQIRDEFNKQKDTFRTWGEQSGFAQALQDISQVIDDLKGAGLDIELEMLGSPSEQAFSMALEKKSGIVPISGILRIGQVHQLLAIAVKKHDQPCLEISISKFDIRFTGSYGTVDETKGKKDVRNEIRAETYDLKNDPDALVKFTRSIIDDAARSAIVAENDVAPAFKQDDRPRKVGLKLKALGNG